jgi:uncharacterized membrane protein YhhN
MGYRDGMSFAIACAVLVCALLVAEVRDHRAGRAVAKIGASLAFIAAAVWWNAAHSRAAGWLVLAALALSAVGDVALLWRDKRAFLAGLGAFLLAHVAYAAAFVVLGVSPMAFAVALVGFGGFTATVYRQIEPHAADLARPVLAYVAVITVMVACAAGAAVEHPDVPHLALFVAAAVFMLSDVCVARDRFVAPGVDNRLIGLPLYYGAQLGFAAYIHLASR